MRTAATGQVWVGEELNPNWENMPLLKRGGDPYAGAPAAPKVSLDWVNSLLKNERMLSETELSGASRGLIDARDQLQNLCAHIAFLTQDREKCKQRATFELRARSAQEVYVHNNSVIQHQCMQAFVAESFNPDTLASQAVDSYILSQESVCTQKP